MTVALLCAFCAALCYGVASVLQAMGARTSAISVFAVTRSPPYLAGIGLDLVAFATSTVALRRLPLFSVQAIVASSVVVAALLASAVLGLRLRRSEVIAITAVCFGLVLLGSSSSNATSGTAVDWLPATALIAAILAGAAGAFTLRRRRSGRVLGLLAGVAFSLVSLSVRLLTAGPSARAWLTDPAVYALLVSGALAVFLYAAALQGARVTAVTAVVVTIEALLPAAVGVLLLGDRAAPGRGWLALLGFAGAICGAVALSRSELDPTARRGRHRRGARPLVDALSTGS